MGKPRCYIPQCRNSEKDGFKVYEAPLVEALRAPWVKYLQDHGRIENIPKYFYICELHFKIYITPEGNKCRRYHAPPSVPMSEWGSSKNRLEVREILKEMEETTSETVVKIKPTCIVKINMKALNSGDFKNIIQSLKKVDSTSKPQPKIIKTKPPTQINHPHRCTDCSLSFPYKSQLIMHSFQAHTSQAPTVECKICKRKFPFLKALQIHMNNDHDVLYEV